MSQDVTGGGLSARQRLAVPLVADGALADEEIAAAVGLRSRRTIIRWRQQPGFAAAVAALVARAAAAAEAATIANKAARLAVYQRRHEAIEAVIAARARQYAGVPGGDTGLLVAEPVLVKVYEVADPDDEEGSATPIKQARIVHVYKVDVATLKEDRDTLKQAAIELRQWVERSESTSRAGASADLDLAQLTDEELAELERLTAKAAVAPGGGG